MKNDTEHKCIMNRELHKKTDCPLLKGMKEVL